MTLGSFIIIIIVNKKKSSGRCRDDTSRIGCPGFRSLLRAVLSLHVSMVCSVFSLLVLNRGKWRSRTFAKRKYKSVVDFKNFISVLDIQLLNGSPRLTAYSRGRGRLARPRHGFVSDYSLKVLLIESSTKPPHFINKIDSLGFKLHIRHSI